MASFLVAVLAYVGGSIPMGLLVSRWAKGVDIRKHGSGNIGATNVLRTIGARWAVVVFLFDAAKGVLPVLLGRHLGLTPAMLALVAFLAVAGHNWSCFLRLKGGKGVATSLGVLLALAPGVAAAVALIWVFVVAVTGYASLGSMLALGTAGPILQLTAAPAALVWLGVVLFLMTVYQHRANIKRLIQGKELPMFNGGTSAPERNP